MHKFTFDKVTEARLVIDELEVQSYEMNVYLVKLTVNGLSGLVYNDEGNPMRFHNTLQIREAFAQCHVVRAIMTHDSPYDEMIGNPPKPRRSASLPFCMQLPY